MLIVTSGEIDTYLQQYQCPKLSNIGNERWLDHHDFLEKISLQGVLDAKRDTETVIGPFSSQTKADVLIEEMISLELWRTNILPLIPIKNLKTTFVLYLILKHEETLWNILEIISFNKEIIPMMEEEHLVELIELVAHNLYRLLAKSKPDNETKVDITNLTEEEEIKHRLTEVQTAIQFKSLTILQYIFNCAEDLSPSTVHYLMTKHCFISILVEHLLNRCWTRYSDNNIQEQYIDCVWTKKFDGLKLNKYAAQIWICLYHIVMNSSCCKKIQWNEYMRKEILKVKDLITPLLIDQLPILNDLLKVFNQIVISNIPKYSDTFLIEIIPNVRNNLEKRYKGQYQEIGEFASKNYLNLSDDQLRLQAKKWSDTYSDDILETLVPKENYCASCSKIAEKRCGRCKLLWYCSRSCQVKDWSIHKPNCIATNMIHNE
ncbi:hypothetical protein SNEBB_000018 [Seison nebaliae]|nr:hypothetical protein SNEBB_000018 [Seison nebaliae]